MPELSPEAAVVHAAAEATAVARRAIRDARRWARRALGSAEALHESGRDDLAGLWLDGFGRCVEIWARHRPNFAALEDEVRRQIRRASPASRGPLEDLCLNLQNAQTLWRQAESEFRAALTEARRVSGVGRPPAAAGGETAPTRRQL